MTPKIAFRDVVFSYQGRGTAVEALRNISFACYEREIVAVVGPSGCGKSTLIGLTAGLRNPLGGEVMIDGRVVTGPSKEIGVMFQKSTLLPWRSIVENVELGLEVRGVPRQQRNTISSDLIRRYGLGGFENKYPHALSGGMQKRAALIQTLAYDPAILLLDEAFAALDAQTRLLVQDEFVRICREHKKTVLMVTHDIGEAISMADRIVVFSARPATVVADHEIRFSRPRTSVLEASLMPEFRSYFDIIWQQLEIGGTLL